MWQIKTAFAIRNDHNFIDKNEYLTIDFVVCRKSFGFFSAARYSSARRLQLTRSFDLIFIRFASQCCTIISIQSKTLMFDAVCPSNSPFLTVDFHMNKQYD